MTRAERKETRRRMTDWEMAERKSEISDGASLEIQSLKDRQMEHMRRGEVDQVLALQKRINGYRLILATGSKTEIELTKEIERQGRKQRAENSKAVEDLAKALGEESDARSAGNSEES